MSDHGAPGRPQPLPPDQEERDAAATHLDVHMLLEAGAGSGKTTALVSRYMGIVTQDARATEEGPAFLDRIAAITFTEKAAREMKERLRAQFIELMGKAESPEEKRRWREGVRRLETAPISTIHALCARVLRQFPLAAGVDPQFEVLDELQTTVQLPAVVRDSLLSGLAEERVSAGLAIGYYEGLSGAAEALRALLARREKYRRFLESPPSPDELLAEWERIERHWLAQRLQELATSQALGTLVAQLEDAADIARSAPDDKLSPYVLEMASLVATPPEPAHQAVVKWLEDLEKAGKSGGAGRKTVWEEAGGAKAVRDLLKEVLHTVLAYLGPAKDSVPGDRQTAEIAAALWREARSALDAWQHFKDLAPALDYDDLQSKLRDLLREHEAVRSQLQARLRHVLVDEFQDTSQLQREIVELLSGLRERPAEAARVFVVGDPKQSIYRFRDADVTVYNKARQRFEADEGCEVRRLSTSFRPNAELMAYFNDVFARPELLGAEPEHPFETRYEPMDAVREFAPLRPPAVGLLVVDDNSEILYRRVAEGRAIANFIAHLLDDPPLIYDHDAGPGEPRYRPLRAGDIAILFRAMTEAYLYEDQLWEKGLPYYNASSRGLFTRPEITDMLNVLRVLADPADDVALVGVLRSPMFAISDETLFRLAQDRRRTWWERLQAAAVQDSRAKAPYDTIAPDQRRRLERASSLLRTWRRQREHRALSALVRDVIERTGYSAALAAQVGGVRAVANLGKLTDLARRFEQTGQAGVRAFAQFLTTLAEEDTQEAQAPTEEEKGDSIWLSSVHAAKGLQWPVVIVADLTRPPRGSEKVPRAQVHPTWGLVPAEPGPPGTRRWRLMARIIAEQESLEQESENKRLLYVAMTRASDVLVLSSSLELKGDKLCRPRLGSWLELLMRAAKLEDLSKVAPPQGLELLIDSSLCPWYLMPSSSGELPRLVRQPLPEELAEETVPLASAATSEESPGLSTSPEGAKSTARERAEAPARPVSGIEVALKALAPDVARRRRFSVTELAHYLSCPQYHKLRYVDGLPDLSPIQPAPQRRLTAMEMGTLAHRLLQMVGTGGMEQLNRLLGRAIPGGGYLRRLAEDEIEQLRELLAWYLKSRLYVEEIAPADRLRTEAWVSFPLEGALVEGKVDVVAHASDGVVLLDYKTGMAQSALEDEGGIDADRFQLALYAFGLRQVLGQVPKRGALVYLKDRQILQIEPTVEAEEAASSAREAIVGIREGRFAEATQRAECSRCRLRWACEVVASSEQGQ